MALAAATSANPTQVHVFVVATGRHRPIGAVDGQQVLAAPLTGWVRCPSPRLDRHVLPADAMCVVLRAGDTMGTETSPSGCADELWSDPPCTWSPGTTTSTVSVIPGSLRRRGRSSSCCPPTPAGRSFAVRVDRLRRRWFSIRQS